MIENNKDQKLFIVGVQRSGTTLLRSILHAHPQICAGYECAFYKLLYSTYPDGISGTEELEAFLTSLFSVRRFEHWDLTYRDVKKSLLECGQTDTQIPYPTLIEAIGRCLRDTYKPDADYIGYKNPNGIFHCNFIFNLFSDAKILHISRDPRGVLGSEKKKSMKMQSYDPSHVIWTVAKRYKRMRTQHEIYKDDPRYIQIWYEDLITDFEPTLDKIMNFLGLESDISQLEYHLQAQNKNFTPETERWQHAKTLEAPDQSRTNAFMSELTKVELSTLEYLCREDLRRFGLEDNIGSRLTGVLGISKLYFDKTLRLISRRLSIN